MGQWYHTKGQKGWYQEQPQALEATQILVDKPPLPKARIPVLKARLNNPPQVAKAQPLVPPVFPKAPAKNPAGQRFSPIPPLPQISPPVNTMAHLPPQYFSKEKGRQVDVQPITPPSRKGVSQPRPKQYTQTGKNDEFTERSLAPQFDQTKI